MFNKVTNIKILQRLETEGLIRLSENVNDNFSLLNGKSGFTSLGVDYKIQMDGDHLYLYMKQLG